MLQFFTPQNRQDLIKLLDLSIDEISEGSILWRLLLQVEERDRQYQTNFAIEIQALISEALFLRSAIFDEMNQGNQYLKREKEDGEYEREWKDSGSELKGKQDRLRQYIKDIQRLLGYTNRSDNNTLRTVWPGGGVQRQNISSTHSWLFR
jgi:hypothetical protein